MSKRTIFLIALLAVLASTLVILALSPKKQEPAARTQTPATTPSPTDFPKESILSLSPNPLVIQTNTTTPSTINVDLTTGTNDVTAVQLELTYNPKAVTIVDVAAGSFFDNPLVLIDSIDATNGRVTYALGIQPTGTGKKGTGTVAKITLRPAAGATGQTTLSLAPKTLVTATGIPASVLKDSVGTTIIFSQQSTTQPAVTSPAQ